jgi:putative nucleotidyltransferase with HDIG domain
MERDGLVVNFESEVYRRDGTTVWISEGSKVVRDDSANVKLFEGTALDITERKQAEFSLQRQLRRLSAVSEIDRAVASSLDLRLSLSVLLTHVRAQLEVDAACVLTLDPVTHVLSFSSGSGFRTEALRYTKLPLGQGYAGKAAMEREIVHVENLRRRETDFLRSPTFAAEDFDSYWGVPLIATGTVRGVLEVFHRTPLERDDGWLAFLRTLAGQAAIAIDHASMFEDLQRSSNEMVMAYDAAIQGWSNAMDLRDRMTEGHTQRVADMAVNLATAMGLGADELMHLRRGALLHDIGKMGVPDAILFKPGKLTDDEWVVMKKHPELAYAMLAPIRQLREALEIPWCHHEKWDGSGYPRALKGEQIPLAARIFAIVDVWDALTSDRPYRTAWSVRKALDYIRDQAGTHFDPAVVKVCLESRVLEA